MRLVAIMRSVWHGLDVLRRVLHLIVLLVLFGLLLTVLGSQAPRLPDKAALVIHPSGEVVEQLSGGALERALAEARGQEQAQTLLWDLTEAIRNAASDERISALVIEPEDISSIGQAKLSELSAAIAEFRATGKPVVASGRYFEQHQFLLAAQASEIYLDPFGMVLIDGYDRFRMYFKAALDKLAIDMHLFRAGKYKSADEPFVRRDMSAEDRAASEVYLRALWNNYRQALATARGKTADDVARYVDGFSVNTVAARGDLAKLALEAGWVTALKSGAEVEQRLIELIGTDNGGTSYPAVAVDDYLTVRRIERRVEQRGAANIAVVVASGEMLDGVQPSGTIGGASTAALLREAREDEDIQAVVLRVDSPGGSVTAAEDIHREVLALKAAGKKIVVSMSDVAASGGYYIAAAADRILAHGSSITGSIGVYAAVPTFNRSLDKLGVNVDGVGTTALSGALRLDRPLTRAVSQILQSTVDRYYDEFLARVATGRGKSREQIDVMAQGRVWAGSDALGMGLIDELGGYEAALKSAAGLAQLGENYRERRIEPTLSWSDQLLLNMRSGIARGARALGLAGTAAQRSLRSQLEPMERELLRWQRMSDPKRVYSYCYCVAP